MKTLSVINPQAAAIDVGSEQLHLSIAGDEPVVFGTVTNEVYRLRDYVKGQGVTTVAMEATGVYWLYAYVVLEAAGLEVVVVNGRYVRNLPGRKTDMADCQWLDTLHAHGLLRGGFVPPAAIRRLQDYQRLRADHIIGAASQIQKMPQALERMNIKFHDVLSDLTGVSGLKVVRAILAGQRDPEPLLELCDVQIQKKKRERVSSRCAASGRRSICLPCSRRCRSGSFTKNSWLTAIGRSKRCSQIWPDRSLNPRLRSPALGAARPPNRRARMRRRSSNCIKCWCASVGVGM